jgi:hypothetical protein
MAKSPEELQASASEACVRGGAFVLLLSLALAGLIPLWSHRKDELILGRYLGLRLNLVAALDALDENPIWQEYNHSHETETAPLEQLMKVQLNSATLAPFNPSVDLPKSGSNETGTIPASSGVPEPPTGLGFVVGFSEIQQAADYLTQLNDSDLLTRSRNASDFFNFSIYRWVLKRDNLIAQSRWKATPPMATVNGQPDAEAPANFAAAADEKVLLGLSLGAVRELANSELPSLANTVKLGRNDSEVEITASSLPRSLYGASLFGQVLLFFVIVYFYAFARNATSATNFPLRETVFGAFAGSRPTLAVFFLAIWTPLAVSLGILFVSYGATSRWGTVGLAVCSGMVGLAVGSVYVSFSRKSYFRGLVKFGGSAE